MYDVTQRSGRPIPADYLNTTLPKPRPPLLQERFDLDETVLWEAIHSDPSNVSFGLLENYFTDLFYSSTVDPGVFLYLLPKALEMWAAGLDGNREALYGVGEFHSALFRKSSHLRTLMGLETERNVIRYMCDILAHYIDDGCVLEKPHLQWVPHWTGATCGLPTLAEAWFRHLEEFRSPARTNAYLIYLSRIIYRPADNPLFFSSYEGVEPWTRATSIIGEIAWQPDSLSAARSHLSAENLIDCLGRVGSLLRSDDLAKMLVVDMLGRGHSIDMRVSELIRNLSELNPPDYWSDAF